MNKNNANLLIAVVFLIGFLFFWDSVVMSRYGKPPSAKSTAVEKAAVQKEDAELSSIAAKEAAAPTTGSSAGSLEKLTTLSSPEMEVTFDSKGARVVSWKIFENDHWLQLVPPENHRKTSPLETFPQLNFSVQKISDNQAVWTAIRPDGLKITKQFSLLSNPPLHSVDVRYANTSSHPIQLNARIGWGNGLDKHPVNEPYTEKDSVMAEQRAVAFDGHIKHWRAGFIFSRTVNLEQGGSFKWAGVDNHHFLAALIAPEDGMIPKVSVETDRTTPPVVEAVTPITLAPGEQKLIHYQLFVGPKRLDELKAIGHNLSEAVDFGFFGFISKILLYLLKTFQSVTHNYGWAIILLTFLIQLVVFPLTIKNLKHSLRMKELQPQLKKIQEQFKSDPKRLQVETFNLYRKNGMKFMGMEGCFPMLLQIPIFFAFYSTLNVAYELRGAPWIFWIHDLGAHDPYYVLPILMGLGMFLQQKMTAMTVDPAQARMMMLMPVMMTFMFLKLPAGLVLYWCVNSLTTILVQLFMQKRSSHPAPV